MKNYPSTEIRVEKLKHAFVTRSMFAGTIRGVSPASLPLPEDAPQKKGFDKVFYLSFLKNGLRVVREDNLYFVFNLWSAGYHHFLTEAAIKFPLFEKELREGQILMPTHYPQFAYDFFKLTGFENLYPLKRNCYVNRLNVITNPISGFYERESLLRLREFVSERINPERNSDFDKIYVSRKNSRARKVLNEDELVNKLQKAGFKCLELDNVPFAEQINIFRNCRILLSIHGAALTNSIFMPAGGRVFELFPEQPAKENLNSCYSRMDQELHHEHEYLFCRREHSDKAAILDTDNIYVDVDKVLKAML